MTVSDEQFSEYQRPMMTDDSLTSESTTEIDNYITFTNIRFLLKRKKKTIDSLIFNKTLRNKF